MVRKIVSISGLDTTDQNIRALQVNSTEFELIHELFMKLYDQQDRHFKVFTFQEAKGVTGINYLGFNERVGPCERSSQRSLADYFPSFSSGCGAFLIFDHYY